MKKPPRLKKGANIAIVSPSWGGPSVFPHIFDAGIQNLRDLGLNPVAFPTARMDAERLYRRPDLRAKDINAAFADTNIDGIMASIGGSDSVRILKYLDIDTLQKQPKFLMGYSDFTTLTTYLNLHGLVTFQGPSVMAGFSQWPSFSARYRDYVHDFFFSPQEQGTLPTFKAYSNGYPDWQDPQNTGKLATLHNNEGPRFLQGTGTVTGELFGGCIEVLEMMKGTAFWPKPGFWQQKILFLETSEDKPTLTSIRCWLRNYGVMGVFDALAGICFGRAMKFTDEEKAQLDHAILSVIREEFGQTTLPIVTNLDFGHTDPQLILPLGISFAIDCDKQQLVQCESAFSDCSGTP